MGRGRSWMDTHLDLHVLPPHLVAQIAALYLEPLRLILQVFGLVHQHLNPLASLQHLHHAAYMMHTIVCCLSQHTKHWGHCRTRNTPGLGQDHVFKQSSL
jgi:hypothetical protein